MRIPPRVLQAPPSYLEPEAIAALKRMGFGCVPVWTGQGCALFVYIDSGTIRSCRDALHNVRLELHRIGDCPLIRLDVWIGDNPQDPLHMDCFLNIQDPHFEYAIEALGEQEWILFHWYDQDLKYVRSSGVRWSQANREVAKEIINQARELVEETGGGDFDSAKAEFVKENPIA